VSELFDNRFVTMDLSALGVDLGHQLRSQCAQLFGGHLVEIGQGSHGGGFYQSSPTASAKRQHLKQCNYAARTDSVPG